MNEVACAAYQLANMHGEGSSFARAGCPRNRKNMQVSQRHAYAADLTHEERPARTDRANALEANPKMNEENSGMVNIPLLLEEMRAQRAAAEVRLCSCAANKPRSRLARLAAPAVALALLSLGANAFAFARSAALGSPAEAVAEAPPPTLVKARPRPWHVARTGSARENATASEVLPERVTAHHVERPWKTKPNVATTSPKLAVATPAPTAEPLDEARTAPPPASAPDLDAAMRLATGTAKARDVERATAEPESAARQLRPAQGAIVAALRAVQGGARACLDADDAPRVVSVTFVASGVVTTVEPATSDGKGACIVNALRVAKVEPFAETSFRARVTIRPK